MGELAEKRGQVTIFIIIALIIIGVALLLYLLRSPAEVTFEFDEKNPSAFIQTCLEDEIENAVETTSLQGGSMNPEHYILYQDNKIEYLCFTEEYYKTCVVQQPLLKGHIESEIENEIKEEVINCFNELENNYVERNYNVNLERGKTSVELLPKRVVSSFDYVLTASKAETERYDSFNVILNNNLYELVSITNSIISWEAAYGDAETTLYMSYYHDLKVEKKKQQDGSTIYILTDRNNENKFQFASRSVAWPPGYGDAGVAA
jgi:hypothetical protein